MPKTDSEFQLAQKREAAGYKATIHNSKATPEAKAAAEKKLKALQTDEKYETIGDRIRTRERNEEQEKKDETYETVGDRVRARGRVSAGGPGSASANAASAYLAGEKNPRRIIAGLKASLKNPNTSDEKKEEIRAKLKQYGEPIPVEAETADATAATEES